MPTLRRRILALELAPGERLNETATASVGDVDVSVVSVGTTRGFVSGMSEACGDT